MSSTRTQQWPSTSPMMFITSDSPARSRRLSTIASGALSSRLARLRARTTPPTSGDTTIRFLVGVARLDVGGHHRRRPQIVGRDVEEALDLAGVEIHRQHPVGAGDGDEVGDQLGRDRRARAGLPVLPGIAEIGDDRGDPLGRGALQRVDADQQLHQIVVGREAGRLDHEHVLAADILLDLDEHFLVGEAADAGLGQRQLEIVGDRPRQRQVRIPGEQFHCDDPPAGPVSRALRKGNGEGQGCAELAGGAKSWRHRDRPPPHRPRPAEPAGRRPRRQCRSDARMAREGGRRRRRPGAGARSCS